MEYLKNFVAKRVISILVNFRYFRFKLLKYKENNKKTNFVILLMITSDIYFNDNELGIIRKALFCIIRRKKRKKKKKKKKNQKSKMALNPFCDETLHLLI